MLQKPEESTHNTLFNGIETKLLVSSSKPRIHEGFLTGMEPELRVRGGGFVVGCVQ